MTATTTGAGASASASGRSSTRKATTNGKPSDRITVRGVKLQIRRPVRFGLFKKMEQGDSVQFLEGLLTEDSLDSMWEIELPGEHLREELDALITEIAEKVSEAVGLTPGE